MSVLKKRRNECGMTQGQLASQLNVEQAAISNWESGRYSPQRKYREALAKILGGKADDYKKEA